MKICSSGAMWRASGAGRGRNISKSMDISEKMSYTRKEELPDGD